MALQIRENTVKFEFDKTRNYRPSPAMIHDWLGDQINIQLDHIAAIQLNASELCVYVKLKTSDEFERLLANTPAQLPFVHGDGTTSVVNISSASDNVKKVRILDLPIELDNTHIHSVLSTYGII